MNRYSTACLRLIGIITVSLSLAACSSSISKNSEMALGIDLPVSGADTSDGVPTRNGVILAIEEANASHLFGPTFHVVASDLDDAVNGKHDPAQGAQNVKSFLADDRVLAMVGPFNSSVATAEIPLTNDGLLAQISPSATSDALTQGEQAKRLRHSHPETNTFFRVCASDTRQGKADAHFARYLGYSRVYVLDDNETYGTGLAAVFEKSFASLGGQVLGHEHITANQQDFKALLTKISALKPDFIFFGGTTSTGGGLVRKQMGDAGMAQLGFVGGDGISDDEFRRVAGDLAEGAAYTVVAPDTAHLPSAQHFLTAYQRRFHTTAGAYSVNGYVAARVALTGIANALSQAHGELPSRISVLQAIAATNNLESPIGKIRFDAYGDTLHSIVSCYKIVKGKPVYLPQGNVE